MTLRTFFAACAVALFTCTAQAQQTLVVGTDIEGKPFNFSQGGTYVGFDQDLLAEIAKELNVRIDLRPMDFAALIPALQTGNVEMGISSIFVTEARARVVDFSDTYYTSALGILVARDDTRIQSSDDLAGKTVAALTGSGPAAWVKESVPQARLSLFPQFANMVMELQAGRAHAVVADYPYLAYYVKTEGADIARLLPEPVGDGAIPVAMAFPKGSRWREPVNAALAKIRADGRYERIYSKWFD